MDSISKLALWYQLSSAKFLGPVRFRKLWNELGDDLGQAFRLKDKELLKFKGAVTKQNLKGIREQADRYKESMEFMQTQMELAEACRGTILTLDDPDYPHFLRRSNQCHPILYCIGQLANFTDYKKSIAIVGSRKPASKSADLAFNVAQDLAATGWIIVSGMAKGIDACSHRGALQANGRTIAVLGCGPDVLYPVELGDLYEQIKRQGLILSEFPFGTKPEDWKLQKRNKTTVALSMGVFVVETTARGGTMNAVKACKEQKKTVFTILPSWRCKKSGNQKAAKDGAVVLQPGSDLASVIASRVVDLSAPLDAESSHEALT
ncbi:MAG: DNA-protecting protein DprA [Phycisphaerae bacterium]|nr:DNA-protecting protein DprA [Phycisphaerae bacterium]